MSEWEKAPPGGSKGLLGTLIALALTACGGGGGDPGDSPFGGSGTAYNGDPSQARIELSAEQTTVTIGKHETFKLTFTAADAKGYPAGVGRTVFFLAETGDITPSCTLVLSPDGNRAECSVSYTFNDTKRKGSKVTIMAWTQGHEAYEDTVDNDRYDSTEAFWDSGLPFLDVDDDGRYDPESGDTAVNVDGPGLGNQPCASGRRDSGFLSDRNLPMPVPNTCDGRWGRAIIHVSRVLPVEVGSP